MKRRLRIAIGRIMQETNALSPVPTTLADFERTHLIEGEALLAACGPKKREVEGLYRNAELSGAVREAARCQFADVEIVPLFSAWAISGGPLDRATYDTLLARLTDRLRAAGPVDGVVLALHGAMGVQGLRDPEADIVRAVKSAANGVPVAATYDLHGNHTRERTDVTDIVCAYHTNPHRDHARTGERAMRLLLARVAGGAEIKTAWRSLPMLLGGGTTIDFLPPLRGIYARIRKLTADPRVLDASLFTVHMWIDHPEVGWSVVVHTNGDQDLAERVADELADLAWEARKKLPPTFPGPAEAVASAKRARLARMLGVVALADASDVVTAGAIGESTALLRALIEQAPELHAFVPIRDAEVVEAFFAREIGHEMDVSVGGKLDPARTKPLPVHAKLRSKHSGGPFGRVVVLDVGRTVLVVTEGAPMLIKPSLFRDIGLEPWKADVVVVKNFFPFRMFFLPISRKTIYVRSGGITDFDAAYELSFNGPLWPRDAVEDWHEADRRRRSVVVADAVASAEVS